MNSWGTATIGSVCLTYSGGTPSTARLDYYGGDIPWIVSADLNKGRILSVKGRITRLGLERSSAKLVDPGTPLIALYGATAGVPALTYVGGAINQAVLAMVPRRIAAEFLYQWLKANRDQIIDRYTQGGQPNLSGAIVRSIELPLPPVSEQHRISAALRDVDDLIAALERMIAKKLAIKQGLLQKLLADEASLSVWPRSRLSGLIDGLEAGISVRSSEQAAHGIAVLKTSAVNGGRFDPTEAKPVISQDVDRVRCNPVAGSLIISRMNTPNLVGEVGYVERDCANLYLPDRLWLARPKRGKGQQVNMRWLGYYLSSEFGSSAVRGLATGTSGSMKNIPKDKLLALEVPTPPPHEQDKIADTVRAVDCAIDLLRDRLVKARDVKQGMMQQLLTGRVRLPAKGIET
ncbi:restriction endonuclease subunit S [Streptomyces sp. NPDC058700]|uniref:restriction endonuclease subunit S n=1 Tax=Streptomyces sp. NPDC058700 TaxID=3346607 RepID=UPI003657FDB0